MPLVIFFFVPDPAKGVAEMARVVCPSGIVTAYAWDLFGGGFPYEALRAEMPRAGRCSPGTAKPGRVSNQTHYTGPVDWRAFWLPSKPARSPCNGHSPISTTTGQHRPWWAERLLRSSQR